MKLFAIIVTNIIILIIFNQAPITIEARKLRKTIGQDHFKQFVPASPGHIKGNANFEEFEGNFKPKEGRKMQKINGQYHFKTGVTDDFAPTSPGNSPGMGHKKGDDFKPTTPGHSPGIGHAVKNDDPKA